MRDSIPWDSLALLGQLLAGSPERFGILVVGGSALLLRGDIQRTTLDVDVIALVDPTDRSRITAPTTPFPATLQRAIIATANELHLPKDWINTQVAAQWRTGLPPRLVEDATWQEYGGLLVGIAGREALIAMKLFAAVDGAHHEKHFKDLCALSPTDEELSRAASWVATQDASEAFARLLDEVLDHVRADRQ